RAAHIETQDHTVDLLTERGHARMVTLSGPLFFGSQAKLTELLHTVDDDVEDLVLDLSDVTTIDMSGASALVQAIETFSGAGETRIWLSCVGERGAELIRLLLHDGGVDVHFATDLSTVRRELGIRPTQIEAGQQGGRLSACSPRRIPHEAHATTRPNIATLLGARFGPRPALGRHFLPVDLRERTRARKRN